MRWKGCGWQGGAGFGHRAWFSGAGVIEARKANAQRHDRVAPAVVVVVVAAAAAAAVAVGVVDVVVDVGTVVDVVVTP